MASDSRKELQPSEFEERDICPDCRVIGDCLCADPEPMILRVETSEIKLSAYPDKDLPYMAQCTISGHNVYGFGNTPAMAEERIREHLAAYWMAKAKLEEGK